MGVYLQLIDTKDANEKLKLYDLPVVGEYFVRPAPSEEEMEKLPVEDAKPNADKDSYGRISFINSTVELSGYDSLAACVPLAT